MANQLTKDLEISRKISDQISVGRHLPVEIASWIAHLYPLRDHNRILPFQSSRNGVPLLSDWHFIPLHRLKAKCKR